MIKEFVILGGGSAYTPGLLQALIHQGASLGLERVRLFDTDSDHLELVGRLGNAMARCGGASFTVETANSLESAIAGADAVLNSTRPGGFKARRLDETVPLALGIPGQETVGPGGFFFALRSVPEALRVADTIAAVAPDALLLNYTNPSNIVTQALVNRGGIRVLGLCDQSDEDLHDLATALGRPGETLSFRCNGLNHATWYSDLHFEGEPLASLPPRLEAPPGLDQEHRLRFEMACEMARTTPGFWPNSYIPYYMEPQRFVALSLAQGPRTDAITAKLPSYYAHFREEAAKEIPQLLHHRGSAGFGDLAVKVIQALQGHASAPLVLNTENKGTTALFAPNTVVEGHGTLSAGGWERLPSPGVPNGHLELLRQLEAYQHLTAVAARSGEGSAIIRALAANPLVGSSTTATELWKAARVQYGTLLPSLA
jgi:6-phospho-beta-glucosidase